MNEVSQKMPVWPIRHFDYSIRRFSALAPLIVALTFASPAIHPSVQAATGSGSGGPHAFRPLTTSDPDKCALRLVDGSEVTATITGIGVNGELSGEGIPKGLKMADVLSLSWSRPVKRDESANVSFHTVGGGVILGSAPRVADERVDFQSSSGVKQLPLQATRAIVWSRSAAVDDAVNQPSRENDVVIVATDSGERRVEGILESIDAQYVGINYRNESRKIGIEKVKAVVTADLGLESPKGSQATVELVDGSTAKGVVSRLTDGQLALLVARDSTLSISASLIAKVSIVSDRLIYLSDIEPIEVQESSVFAIQLPWQRDRSVGNQPLSIRASDSDRAIDFKKGLGTQASSRLVFANANGFDRFVATVGIDSETRGRGDCLMVVRGDGIELWSGRVRGSEGPQEIDVDIAGINQVELHVYPGEGFDLGDHANWCNARFLKTR